MEKLNLEKIKADVLGTLISKLDLERLSTVQQTKAREAVSGLILEIVADRKMPLSASEKEKIQSDLLDEVFGLGPLEALLRDPRVSDILVNSKDVVYIERGGKLEKTDIVFRDDRHVMQIIDRIVSKVGRRIDESSPMVDARLPDGSRVNAIIPPLALDGPVLSIRRFRTDRLGARGAALDRSGLANGDGQASSHGVQSSTGFPESAGSAAVRATKRPNPGLAWSLPSTTTGTPRTRTVVGLPVTFLPS